MSEVIAVLGATGRTGGATLRSLVERGARVRALTRDPGAEGARRLAHPLVDLVAADMHDPGSLRSALTGADRLLSVQPGFDDRGRHQYEQEVAQGTAVAAAASQVGVRHVVQMAAAPAYPPGFRTSTPSSSSGRSSRGGGSRWTRCTPARSWRRWSTPPSRRHWAPGGSSRG